MVDRGDRRVYRNKKKQRSMKHTYNLFVYELYCIKERRDLMLKYDLKSYFIAYMLDKTEICDLKSCEIKLSIKNVLKALFLLTKSRKCGMINL